MIDTMLEKAARAAYDASPMKRLAGVDPFSSDPSGQTFAYAVVRAVLTAIRDPNEAMVKAAMGTRRYDMAIIDCEHDADMVWESVIDAILAEKPK